jgi:hypothetical protein
MVTCKDFCDNIGECFLKNRPYGQIKADLPVILRRIGQTREKSLTGESHDTCLAKMDYYDLS